MPCTIEPIATGWIVRCQFTEFPVALTRTVDLEIKAGDVGNPLITANVNGDAKDPAPANNTDQLGVSTISVAVFDLALTKTPTQCVFERGATGNAFLLSINNRGPDTAPSLVVSDTIPVGMTLLTVDSTPAVAWDVVGGVFMAWVDSLPVGTTQEITLNIDATVEGWATNQATVIANGIDLDPSNDNDAVKVFVIPPPDYVVNTADDIDDGTCDTVHCSLREAMNAVNGFAQPKILVYPCAPSYSVLDLNGFRGFFPEPDRLLL